MALLSFLTDPRTAFSIFAIWIVIFMLTLGGEGIFSNNFMHFGPSSDPVTQTKFLGSPVNTWTKVITIYALGFFSVVFSTYYNDIFGSWITHYVKNHKEPRINMKKGIAYAVLIIDPILETINDTLGFFVLLTLQLQFIIPQLIGHVFVTIFSTKSFLSKKSFLYEKIRIKRKMNNLK